MTTGQIKQAEVDPLTEAPVEGASTAAFPRWVWLCLAAGVLGLGFVIYTGIHARTTRGIESGSGNRRILAPDSRGGSP